MAEPSIIHSSTSVTLRAAPINPDWILEGKPVARNALLSRSRDGTASTMVWDCTAGKFNWIYNVDETVHILEGNVVVSDDHTPPRRLGPGDVAFFPAGTVAHWHVENYVRKIAFCRRALPKPLELAVHVLRRARALMKGGEPRDALMGVEVRS